MVKRTASVKPRTMNAPIMVSLLLVAIVITTVIAFACLNALPDGQRKELLSHLKQGVPEKHLIPEGYTGWLIVDHNVEVAAILPTDEGVNIFRYPDSGMLRTSSRWHPGIKQKNYFFKTGSGSVKIANTGPDRQIWGNVDVTMRDVRKGPVVSRRSCFFVGTRGEYRKAGRYFEQHALEIALEKQKAH